MTSYYKKLVKSVGEDKAKAYMKDLRSKVKHPGFASNSEAARAAQKLSVQSRQRHKQNAQAENPQSTKETS